MYHIGSAQQFIPTTRIPEPVQSFLQVNYSGRSYITVELKNFEVFLTFFILNKLATNALDVLYLGVVTMPYPSPQNSSVKRYFVIY